MVYVTIYFHFAEKSIWGSVKYSESFVRKEVWENAKIFYINVFHITDM